MLLILMLLLLLLVLLLLLPGVRPLDPQAVLPPLLKQRLRFATWSHRPT